MKDTNVEGSSGLSKNEYLLAGSVSGFVSRAIVQPLDVLKIRFQLQVEPICDSTASKYHGFVQAIRCISKEEGAVAFWKGHTPAQLQAVTFSAIQFMSFEVFVSWLVNMNGITGDPRLSLKSSSTLETFLCGSLAGSFAAGVTQPLDVMRTRFIAQGEPKLYQNMAHAALYIGSREGLPGFFRGLVPSLLLIAPQTGLQFAIYHTFNQLCGVVRHRWAPGSPGEEQNQTTNQKSSHESHRISPVQSLVSGGLAGMGSKCIIYPLDMIKKRMQIHGFEEARIRFGRVPRAGSLRDCLVNVWKTEGAAALFKGLRPTLLKSCVSISCRFTAYEQVCRFLFHFRHTKKDSTSGRTF